MRGPVTANVLAYGAIRSYDGMLIAHSWLK